MCVTDTRTETLREQLRLQRAALADFGLFAFRCDDIDALLNRATELVSDAMGVPLVKVLEHFPERGEMLLRSGVNWKEGVVGHETFGDDARSPGGYALRARHPVVSPDLEAEDRFEVPDLLRRHGVKSMVNVIIEGERAAFGILEVDCRDQRHFGDDDIAFLRTYANLLAAAIDRLQAHRELERSAREQRVLAWELGHRVKNLLGVIRALAAQTSTHGRSAEEFRSAFIDRLQALATAESLVFENSAKRVDPMTLAEEVLLPYRRDDPSKIEIRGSHLTLSSRQARMLGLALHELATNAAKYGALSVAEGIVRLDWRLEERDGTHRLALTWQEADGPEIAQPERRGFGTRLLEEVVTYELQGEAELVYERAGLRYGLTFAVDETCPPSSSATGRACGGRDEPGAGDRGGPDRA